MTTGILAGITMMSGLPGHAALASADPVTIRGHRADTGATHAPGHWTAAHPEDLQQPPAGAGATGPMPLSLETAIEEALQRNPDLAARQAAVDVARHRPAQERALAPPMLGAEIWQWPLGRIDPRRAGGYMVMVEQTFPGRGKRALREQAAASEILVLEHEADIDARMVVEAVTDAYTELALARASAGVYRANLDLLRQVADSTEIRYAAGRGGQPDVLQPIIEISRLHDRLIEEDARTARAEARLNRWMGRPVDGPVGPLDPLEDRHFSTPAAELQRLALDQQPALRATTAEIARARAMLAVAEAGDRPDLTVQGGYMFMPGERDTWTAQVAISWPRAPWARRGFDARVAEAREAVAAARARHDALEGEIRLAVQDAFIRVQTAQRRLALLRTSVIPQIEQTFAVVRAAYQADRADLPRVLEVQRLLLDTRLEAVEATAALAVALAGLSRAVGTDVHAPPTTAAEAVNAPGTPGAPRLP